METALLHNMSVPPRSIVTVRRSRLPGVRFAVRLDVPARTLAAIRRGDAAALFAEVLDGGAAAREGRAWLPGEAERQFEVCMREALSRAGIPERIGVFVESDGDSDLDEAALPQEAALAVLARRSGALYLPRRRFEASLIAPARLILMFPES